jgi:transposase-like protein
LEKKEPTMPKSRPPYPAEFRQQMIELVHAGRNPSELAREFACSAQTVRNWVAQAAVDSGKPLPVTTRRDARQRPAPDLVNREFVAVGPNRLWVPT